MEPKSTLLAISKTYIAVAFGSKFTFSHLGNSASNQNTVNINLGDSKKITSISISNKFLALSTESENIFSLMLYDLELLKFICKKNSKDKILKLSMTHSLILAICHNSASVYSTPSLEKILNVGTMDYDSPPYIGSIVEITNNYTAFGNLPQSTWCFVAVSGFVPGSIRIYQTFSDSNKNLQIQSALNSNAVTIQAHQHSLQFAQFSNDAKLIATASKSGKIIRVFNTITGELIHTFQIGTFESKIENICFSTDDRLLSCYCANGTFYTFDLLTDQSIYYNSQNQKQLPKSKLKVNFFSKSVACLYQTENDAMILNQKGKAILIHINNTNIDDHDKNEKSLMMKIQKEYYSFIQLK
ncbi:autophagy protein [Tritrichomonas musculus]|uniref:Autophagy protein n=1 Tax=Tritrichomonas musculus TaxID=1915356 RepID=A0ABR2KER8_9EUKA